ncbi:MAG TPA: hypothetical protein VE956_07065 [Nodularia sp. (in: cyanobacteria)]|uniref:hypothetical protein n=1 Tax=Nostoc commune TaxID=1178 RepID=UPI0015E81DBC|nr:hypothetical protein [Nostoc commune]HYW19069.1 hypothetical protein [Nodularia sp. (in: cyanobacteria)]
MTTQVIHIISFDIPQTLTQVESAAIQGCKGSNAENTAWAYQCWLFLQLTGASLF